MMSAYEYLIEMIDQGVEYPDAEWRAVSRFGVDVAALAELYDRSEA
ncbi:MAG: hypothetical protein AB8B85_02760 [Paracoccaceae bacterium]